MHRSASTHRKVPWRYVGGSSEGSLEVLMKVREGPRRSINKALDSMTLLLEFPHNLYIVRPWTVLGALT